MPAHLFQLTVLHQRLEDAAWLGEALFFPEFSCIGDEADDVTLSLLDNAGRLLRKVPGGDLWQRRGPAEVGRSTLTLELSPPTRSPAWREPVTLKLPVLRWQHADAFLAFVPALGIEVVAASAEELDILLPRHALVAVRRQKAARLDRLTWLSRPARLEVRTTEVEVDLPTPKQVALASRAASEQEKSVLQQVATRLDTLELTPAYEVDAPLALLAETLAGRQPRSVLLIGPAGVGKTALLHELVRRRSTLGLAARPFWATSGARLVAGQSGFGMWQERCQKLLREAARTQAVLHLGNLVELLEVGKSEDQTQGLGTFLRPWIARGELLAVAECTPEQIPLLERQDPHLLRAFAHLRLHEPTAEQLETILDRFAGRRLVPGSRAELLRLHRRYAAYSANPGRPLRFLRNLLADQPGEMVIPAEVVTAAFARETGLPRVLLEESVRLDLTAAREWFAARVIGQGEAVDLVVDLLATIKAALNRPHRPIASLLFIGPTGVGKTEMAKALAEFLFGSKERLTRFDMSEFADSLSVQRLIGGVPGRSGEPGEGVLTAKVREQPFAVILLDEVEKAHPLLFDLLLQVLGEGRLTDVAGRLADFSNSVVIMTSNLGAESYLQGNLGLLPGQLNAARAREHFRHAVEQALRPELFNRIDRIVPFAPLDEDTTRRIAARQLQLLRDRDGIRYRGVTLEVSDELTGWLAARGHDPRYGARPLKRAVERLLLAPLAAQMNTYTADTALRVQLGVEGDQPRVTVRGRADASGQALAAGGLGQEEVAIAEDVVTLRRSLQQLAACSAMLEVNNDIYRMERSQRHRPEFHDPDLALLIRLRDEVHSAVATAVALEDETLIRLYAQGAQTAQEMGKTRAQLTRARAEFDRLVLAVYLRRFEDADRVSLAVFSEDSTTLFALAGAYHDAAAAATGRVTVWHVVPGGPGQAPERRVVVRAADAFGERSPILVRVWDAEKRTFRADPLNVAPRAVIGLGLQVQGPAAYARLSPEEGLHVFQSPPRPMKALVVTGNGAFPDLTFPDHIDRKGTIGAQPRRRLYRLDQGLVEDARTGVHNLPDRSLVEVMTHCLEQTLGLAAREVLKS